MRITITGKNFKTYKHLEDTIEKKFERLGKYFSDDIDVKVVLSQERGKDKIEVNINAKGAVFRTEVVSADIYEGIDKSVDKLASQMAKFKGKLQKRYNDNKSVRFEALPDLEEDEPMDVVKTKQFDLRPMDVEEAILEMEMMQHDFFIYLNMDTGNINVVYKRNDAGYGVIEPRY